MNDKTKDDRHRLLSDVARTIEPNVLTGVNAFLDRYQVPAHSWLVALAEKAGSGKRKGGLVRHAAPNLVYVRLGTKEYRELHHGDELDVWNGEMWIPTRIEMEYGRWYIIGIAANDLNGLVVRMWDEQESREGGELE